MSSISNLILFNRIFTDFGTMVGLGPGCAAGAVLIWNVLLVRYPGASRLRNEVKDWNKLTFGKMTKIHCYQASRNVNFWRNGVISWNSLNCIWKYIKFVTKYDRTRSNQKIFSKLTLGIDKTWSWNRIQFLAHSSPLTVFSKICI